MTKIVQSVPIDIRYNSLCNYFCMPVYSRYLNHKISWITKDVGNVVTRFKFEVWLSNVGGSD